MRLQWGRREEGSEWLARSHRANKVRWSQRRLDWDAGPLAQRAAHQSRVRQDEDDLWAKTHCQPKYWSHKAKRRECPTSPSLRPEHRTQTIT